jgi:outer membrane lipoprotein-sorting protein
MKTLRLFALFLVAAVSTATVKAQTADEIINKHIQAIGGLDNWKKVSSVVQNGSMTVQGMELNITITVLNNKGSRQDINAMGMNNYIIITPTEGWRFFPIQGQQAPEAMTADDVKESQDGLDAQGTLVDYKAKGHSVELLGKEDVDGTECFKLKVTHKGGKTDTYFIDPTTYYLVKSISVMKANGQEAELSTSYSNYQKLPEGIVVPMSLNIPLGPGFNVDLTISKVEINKAVDESIFKPAK